MKEVTEFKLPVPREPVEIKEEALRRCRDPSWSFLDREKVINIFTLTATYLPKYLWSSWRDELRRRGIPWQLFLRAISRCDRDVEKWVEGRITWEDLVNSITEALFRTKGGG